MCTLPLLAGENIAASSAFTKVCCTARSTCHGIVQRALLSVRLAIAESVEVKSGRH